MAEPVKKSEPKAAAKAEETKVEKVEAKAKTVTPKAEVKTENVADKKNQLLLKRRKNH